MKKILSTFLAVLFLTNAVALGEAKGSLPQAETHGNQTIPLSLKDAAPAFSDVVEGAWYAEAVHDCADRGLIDGTSSTTFSPDVLASRGILVTALYRRAERPSPQKEISFTDIQSGASYGSAAAWAADTGVVSGHGNGRFGGEDPVTREQFAAMIWRAEGRPTPGASKHFADQENISTYAVDAVLWARSLNIINGKGDNLFDPKSNITRGEVAVMLYRWLNQNENSTLYDGYILSMNPMGPALEPCLDG